MGGASSDYSESPSSHTIVLRIPKSWPYAVGALLINLGLWSALFYLNEAFQEAPVQSFQPVRILSEEDFERAHQFAYEKGERKVVHSDEVPKDNEAEADPFPAEYLSDKTRRVKKESQSKLQGLGQKPVELAVAKETSTQNLVEKLYSSGRALIFDQKVGASQKPAKTEQKAETRTFSSFSSRMSTDDLGKSVQLGAGTLLNTDEYRFYGFVNRLKEGMHPLWIQNLRYYGAQVSVQRGEYLVQGTLVLHKDGSFSAIEDWRPSGVSAFDRAVTESLQAMPRTPNPPSEMFDQDGQIRLKFSFRVVNDSSNVVVDYRRSGDDLPRGAR